MDIPFIEHNITWDKEARKLFREKGYNVLPVVEIGDATITEYTGESLLIEMLHQEGYL